MKTIFVIFTKGDKVPVSMIPYYKKYRFLCDSDKMVRQYDIITDPRYDGEMMVVGFSNDTRRIQKGLYVKDINISSINGKHIENKCEKEKVTLIEAAEWYLNGIPQLREVALRFFAEEDLKAGVREIERLKKEKEKRTIEYIKNKTGIRDSLDARNIIFDYIINGVLGDTDKADILTSYLDIWHQCAVNEGLDEL